MSDEVDYISQLESQCEAKDYIINNLKEQNKELQEKLDFFLTEKVDGKEYRPKWELEKLQEQIEKMKSDVRELITDRMNDDIDQNIIEKLAEKWELAE